MKKKTLTKEEEMEIIKDELYEQTWMSHAGTPLWWSDIVFEPTEDQDDDDYGPGQITHNAQEYYLDLVTGLWKSIERCVDLGILKEPDVGFYNHFCRRIITDMEFIDREHAAGRGSYMDIMNFVCAKLVRIKAEMDALYIFEEVPRDAFFTMEDTMDESAQMEADKKAN